MTLGGHQDSPIGETGADGVDRCCYQRSEFCEQGCHCSIYQEKREGKGRRCEVKWLVYYRVEVILTYDVGRTIYNERLDLGTLAS